MTGGDLLLIVLVAWVVALLFIKPARRDVED